MKKDSQTKGISDWELIQYYMKPIAHLFDLDGLTEICVDRYDDIKIEQNGALIQTDAKFRNETDLVSLVTQIGIMLRQPVHHRTHPILDGRLPTGARVNATLFPTSSAGTSMSIRCFPKCQITSEQLVSLGTLTQGMMDYLHACVSNKQNILICGSTGSGKTTVLNVLSTFVGEKERVLVVEDTQELQIKAFSTVQLEAPVRKKQSDDQQVINMSSLIGVALRRRPDRIIVGELRFPDAAQSFLTALNTGHRGCMATIHANSCKDGLYRLDGLIAASESGLPFDFVQSQVRSNIDVVIFQEKTKAFGRRVTEIVEVSNNSITPIFIWDNQEGTHISNLPPKSKLSTSHKEIIQ